MPCLCPERSLPLKTVVQMALKLCLHQVHDCGQFGQIPSLQECLHQVHDCGQLGQFGQIPSLQESRVHQRHQYPFIVNITRLAIAGLMPI